MGHFASKILTENLELLNDFDYDDNVKTCINAWKWFVWKLSWSCQESAKMALCNLGGSTWFKLRSKKIWKLILAADCKPNTPGAFQR